MANVKGFMRKRGSVEGQGVSAQLPPPVRKNFLFSAKGCGAARGYSRSFEHQHNACLHDGKRRGTPQTNAEARAFEVLKKHNIMEIMLCSQKVNYFTYALLV